MATDTASIVKLDDEEHPNFHLTEMNNSSSSFLKKLPKEIRFRIYKFAVYVDEPIIPRQLRRYSNKFTHCSTDNRPFQTAVSLSYTCRAIYAELQYDCPFYKVNTFCFFTHRALNVYLAAITPQRRRNIWWIDLLAGSGTTWSLDEMDYFRHSEAGYYDPDRKPINDEVLAQLSQCDGLQNHELTLELDLTKFCSITGVLQECLAYARDPLALEEANANHSIWSLPFFRLKILTTGAATMFPIVAQLIKRIGKGPPQWFADMATDSSIQDAALVAAKVHFTGAERIAQDKASSLLGPPSSRTRAKCQNFDSYLGIPSKPALRYNNDGIVKTTEFTILQIRWGESDVRCEVQWSTSTSWEDVSIFLAYQHVYEFVYFYHSMLKRNGLSLQEMENTPSPRYILNIAGAHNLGFHDDALEGIDLRIRRALEEASKAKAKSAKSGKAKTKDKK
ncbi:hypothetical protein F5Y06DRAFT_287517 [Hypoxylon sp. FL0890]|nr:hypothetical protein F5Y06DRAFT_287517 [Hypoxylon sp. FL0890]